MALIRGRQVLFQMSFGDDYATVACGKSVTIRTETSVKEITTKGNGAYQDFDYGTLTYTINFDGVLQTQEEGSPTLFDFAEYQKQLLEVNCRVIFTDVNGVVKVFRGQQIVKDVMMGANPSQYADGSITLLGKGEWFFEDFVPTLINFTLSSSAVDPTGTGQFRLRLRNTAGDVIFDTTDLLESSGGYLHHPFNVTTQILSGNYIVEWDGSTNVNGGTFTIDTTIPYQYNFPPGFVIHTSAPIEVDFTEAREAHWLLFETVPDPACVDVTPSGTPVLPDGSYNLTYLYSYGLNGTAPFVLSNVTKPAWMDIQILQNPVSLSWYVQHSGTPDVIADDQPVSYDITNCSAGIYSFSGSVDIGANEDIAVIDWIYTETAGGGTFRIYRNGVQLVMSTVTDSGQVTVNPGDTIQGVLSSSPGSTGHLITSEATDGELDNRTGINTITYFFTAGTGKLYTIEAETTV